MNPAGRPKNMVADSDRRKWEKIREQKASSEDTEFESEASQLPTLDALAWLAGKKSVNAKIDEMVARARSEGEGWGAIAVALGEPGGEKAANKMASRYHKRSQKTQDPPS